MTDAVALRASPSQVSSHLGHHFEKVIVGNDARAHLGDVYGGVHTHSHIHHSEGKGHVKRARPKTLC